jgi:hypothetical protein
MVDKYSTLIIDKKLCLLEEKKRYIITAYNPGIPDENSIILFLNFLNKDLITIVMEYITEKSFFEFYRGTDYFIINMNMILVDVHKSHIDSLCYIMNSDIYNIFNFRIDTNKLIFTNDSPSMFGVGHGSILYGTVGIFFYEILPFIGHFKRLLDYKSFLNCYIDDLKYILENYEFDTDKSSGFIKIFYINEDFIEQKITKFLRKFNIKTCIDKDIITKINLESRNGDLIWMSYNYYAKEITIFIVTEIEEIYEELNMMKNILCSYIDFW